MSCVLAQPPAATPAATAASKAAFRPETIILEKLPKRPARMTRADARAPGRLGLPLSEKS
jgi:hypothetical protein